MKSNLLRTSLAVMIGRHTALLATALALTVPALAQRAPRGETAELSVGEGYAYLNTGNAGVSGKKNHSEFHAAVAYNLVKYVAIGFEYALVPLDTEEDFGVLSTERLHNFGGVGRVGLFQAHGMMPYALISGGGLRLTDTTASGAQSFTVNQSGTYLGVGGGINFYLPHGFGLRPEFRFQHQMLKPTVGYGFNAADSTRNEFALTGTFFYAFGKTHR